MAIPFSRFPQTETQHVASFSMGVQAMRRLIVYRILVNRMNCPMNQWIEVSFCHHFFDGPVTH